MKKLIITITTVIIICASAFAQPDTLWTKTFGGSGNDKGFSVQQTSDGGYIIAGGTDSFGTGSEDVYLIKTDTLGNQQWYQTFGGSDWDWGYSVQQTSDGGYIITGWTESYGAGSADVYLIKTDAGGNQQWYHTFGGSSYDRGYSVQQTSEGGFIIAGKTESYGSGAEDVYLIKTDAGGNQQWYQTFGGNADDEGYSIQKISDGGYIIVGETYSYGAGSSDVYLIKADALGNQQWYKTFGGTGYDVGYSIQQTSDGGYIIAGGTESYGVGAFDVYLVKTDTGGNQQWYQTFGGITHDWGCSVQQAFDGGYIIAGGTESYVTGPVDIYLIKTDALGNQQWYKTFGVSSDTYEGGSVQQTSDGGYIFAGGTESYGAGAFDVYLIRLDSEGSIVEDFGKNKPTTFTLHPPYPNPFNASTVISFELRAASFVELMVYDVMGRKVQAPGAGDWGLGKHEVVWDAEGFASGIYFVELQAGDFSQTRKILLIK